MLFLTRLGLWRTSHKSSVTLQRVVALNLAGSHGTEAFVALFAATAEDGGGGQLGGRGGTLLVSCSPGCSGTGTLSSCLF